MITKQNTLQMHLNNNLSTDGTVKAFGVKIEVIYLYIWQVD
jgi:hypothetical protein